MSMLLDSDMLEAERQIKAVLERFTYRPHWKFEVRDGCLVVIMLTTDADKPDEDIVLTFTQPIPRHYAFMRNGMDWTWWLFEQFKTIEFHELQEFFRIDGRSVYDPHPELMMGKIDV
jgi:hypothetical protein